MAKTVIGAALTVVGSGIVYGSYKGLLLAGDQRWVKQSAVAEKEARDLRREIDELEFIQEFERKLTDRERWQLKRLKSDLEEVK